MNSILRRVIYCSKSTAHPSSVEIVEMCTRFAQKNRQVEITGMLICLGNYFIQVVEGPHSRIEGLIKKISADNRHTCFTVLVDHVDFRRSFSTWDMAMVDLNSRYYVNMNQLNAQAKQLQRFLAAEEYQPSAIEATLVEISESIQQCSPLSSVATS